jgi:ribosome-associated translation inhibitor RaiA
MQVPLEIRYHHLDRSESLDAAIRAHVDRLDKLYDRLVACRVAVECQNHQHHPGNVSEIHIELSLPGHRLVVKEPHKANGASHHPDARAMLKEAFHAAERQLVDFKRRQRDEAKSFGAAALHGSVAQLLPDQDHGFILTAGGSLLYFNRACLTGAGFDTLKIGDNVHYIERDADNGPAAGRVWLAIAEEDEG